MKKTTRISALILILALLLNLSGAAFAATEGIPIEDLDLSTLQMLTTAALEEEEASTVIDDPWGIGGAPCGDENVYCHIITKELVNMNAQKIYDYLDALYTKDLAEGEEGPSDDYAALMLHYGIYHLDLNIICTCGEHPLPLPQFELSDVSAHEPECPWHFNNLTTAEQYVMLKAADEAKKEELEASLDATAAEKLSRVNVGEYTASAEGVSVEISVPEGAFAESYILTAGEAELEAGEESALTEAGVTNVLASFDISFPSLQKESVELQPVKGETVPLTFTVDVTGVEGESVRVFHIKNDGSVEFVGEPIAIEEGAESVTIEVEAESFSTWGVDLWFDENGNKDNFIDTTPAYFPAIGILDKENNDEFVFFVDKYYAGGSNDEMIISASESPDYLVMLTSDTSVDGSKVIYQVDSYDDYFYPTVIAPGYNFIYSKYFSEIVPANELYATVPQDLTKDIRLYKSPDDTLDYVTVSAAELAGEYAVDAMNASMSLHFKLIPSNNWPAAEDYCWVMSPDIVNLSSKPTKYVDTDDWNGEAESINLKYSYAGANSYQWYKSEDGESWTAIDGATAGTLNVYASVSDMMCEYRCEALDANGNVLMESNKVQLVSNEMVSWLRDKSDVVTDEIMALAKKATDRGTALDEAVGVTAANELLWLFNAEVLATIDEAGQVIDLRYHIPVAKIIDGMVYPIDDVVETEETTDEETAA